MKKYGSNSIQPGKLTFWTPHFGGGCFRYVQMISLFKQVMFRLFSHQFSRVSADIPWILSSDVLVYHRDGGETSPFWSNRSTELSWRIKRLESQLRGSDPFGETPQRQNRWLKAPKMYFCCRSISVEFFFGCGFLLVEFDNSFLFFWKEDWENLLSLIIWLFLCGRLEHIMDMFSQKKTHWQWAKQISMT